MRIKMMKLNWFFGIALLISFPLYLMALKSKLRKMESYYKEEVRALSEDIELLHYASFKQYQIEQNLIILDTVTFFNETKSLHAKSLLNLHPKRNYYSKHEHLTQNSNITDIKVQVLSF